MSQPFSADLLPPKSLDIIRDQSARAEKDEKLTKAQLSLIYEHRWFKMFIPSAYGGLQMAVPEALELQEVLAWADGSFGWIVSQCALAGWNVAFIDEETAADIANTDKACVCGNELAGATITRHAREEKLSGIWRNTAGASTATAFAANIKRGKESDEERVMLLKKDQLTISPDGVMMGLLGAECLDIEVTEVAANDNRVFSREVEHARVKGPLYQFPYTQIAETIVAGCISGMARHFIDLSKGIFAETKNSDGVPMTEDLNVQETLRKASQKFDDARTKMFYSVELSWRALQNGHHIKPAILYKVSTAAAELARKARECVDAIYPFCGLDAADKRSDINRVWRDIHTASLYGIALTGIAE